MENPVLGEWLVLGMMILCSCRIFFLRYGKIDTMAVFAPISFVFAIFQIFAWGADIYSVSLLFIAFLCYCVNFRAFLRFTSGLYVDHFNPSFKVGAILVLLLSIFELGMLFFFRPVLFKARNFGVEQKRVRLSGSFNSGFEKSFAFEKSQGEICIVQPESSPNGYSVVIVPDKSSNLLDYKPLAYCLGKKGFKVYLGEFFAKDLKWCRNAGDSKFLRKAWLIVERLYKFKNFSAQFEFYTFNIEKECRAMLNFVKAEESDSFKPVIFVGDWMSGRAIPEFSKDNKADVLNFVLLTDFEFYKTPGFGFIQQTNPTIASKMTKKRDPLFESPKLIADEIFKMIPVSNSTELDYDSALSEVTK